MDRSDIILIGSNVIAILLALLLHYDFAIVIWSYWLESVIIGMYAVAQMLLSGIRSRGAGIGIYLAGAGFFIVHYGMFHLVYMIFLTFLPVTALEWGQIPLVLLTGGIFLVSHGISFFEHSVRGNEKARLDNKNLEQDIGQIFKKPYERIVPMHITIIASGFVMTLVSGGLAAQILLVVLMVLKTGVDLASHRAKHKLGA
jgi:hypothetical protein